MENAPDSTILRLAKVYGETFGDRTLFTAAFESLRTNQLLTVADDQFFSPIHVMDVCRVLRYVCDISLPGIFHCGGPDSLSRLSYFQLLAERLTRIGVRVAKLEPISIDTIALPEKRPKNVTLDSSKLELALGIKMVSAEETVNNLIAKCEV